MAFQSLDNKSRENFLEFLKQEIEFEISMKLKLIVISLKTNLIL